MKIHLHKQKIGNKIRRPIDLVYQGLLQHKDVDLVNSIQDCDYIFAIPHAHRPLDNEMLTQHKDKVVYIDYEDSPNKSFKDPFLYFKRSYVSPLKIDGSRDILYNNLDVKPISFCCFDDMFLDEDVERDIDLGCYLRGDWQCRLNVLQFLKNQSYPDNSIHIGQVNNSTRTTFDNDYLKHLRRTKIIITSNPQPWEGDSRTWESLASGALVFVDRMFVPLEDNLIDGEHCIMYDHTLKGYSELVDKINYYKENIDEAKKIANNGLSFVKQKHMPINRIDYILKQIQNAKN